jgi:hypothetical protein
MQAWEAYGVVFASRTWKAMEKNRFDYVFCKKEDLHF